MKLNYILTRRQFKEWPIFFCRFTYYSKQVMVSLVPEENTLNIQMTDEIGTFNRGCFNILMSFNLQIVLPEQCSMTITSPNPAPEVTWTTPNSHCNRLLRKTRQHDHNYQYTKRYRSFFPGVLGSGKVIFKKPTRRATCAAHSTFAFHIGWNCSGRFTIAWHTMGVTSFGQNLDSTWLLEEAE